MMLKIREGHFDRIMETFSIIQVVFAQMFDIDVSMITVSSVEAMPACTILIAFSATVSGLSMSTISGSSTQVTGPFNQAFVNRGLSYAISSVNANVAKDFSVTLNSQIQPKFPFSMPGVLVLPETFSIDSINAYINVFLATDTLWTSQLFKDMNTLPTV